MKIQNQTLQSVKKEVALTVKLLLIRHVLITLGRKGWMLTAGLMKSIA